MGRFALWFVGIVLYQAALIGPDVYAARAQELDITNVRALYQYVENSGTLRVIDKLPEFMRHFELPQQSTCGTIGVTAVAQPRGTNTMLTLSFFAPLRYGLNDRAITIYSSVAILIERDTGKVMGGTFPIVMDGDAVIQPAWQQLETVSQRCIDLIISTNKISVKATP